MKEPQIVTRTELYAHGITRVSGSQSAGALVERASGCHAAIPGGILNGGRCPQESGHGRPEAHSTERTHYTVG